MEIKCPGCGYIYNVDEKHMPQSGAVFLPCRKCKQKIKIEARHKFIPEKEEAPEEISLSPQTTREGEGMEFFDPSQKTALLYSTDLQALAQINKELADVEFETRNINGLNDLRSRFKYHIYDAIILHQAKADPDEQIKGIMAFINALPPDTRRQIFVIYAYLGGNRLDGLKAFSIGADITISPIDFDALANILNKGIEAKQELYRLFNDLRDKINLEARN